MSKVYLKSCAHCKSENISYGAEWAACLDCGIYSDVQGYHNGVAKAHLAWNRRPDDSDIVSKLHEALLRIGYWSHHGKQYPNHGDNCIEEKANNDSCGCNGAIARVVLRNAKLI